MAKTADKGRDTYEMYRYCRDRGHDQFIKSSEQALRYFASDQWLAADKLKMSAGGRGHVTVNQIFHTVTAVVGEMSQLSTDVRFDAASGDAETADVLNKLSDHVDRLNKSYLHDQAVLMTGLLTGRAYYDLRMDFDNNMQGNIKLGQRRPQNVILDDLESPDPETWDQVFTTEVVSLDDIEMMFGKDAARDVKGSSIGLDWLEAEDKTLGQTMGANRAYWLGDGGANGGFASALKQYRMLSRQYKQIVYKDFFVDLSTGDMSEIPENWPREKVQFALENFGLGTTRRRAKTLRWCVTVNNEVLHSEDSPYKHYTVVPYFPFFLDGATMSLFDVLKGPQDLLNKALSEEIHIMGTTSNSGWKVREGSLKNMTTRDLETKGAQNGLVMILENMEDAQRIEPASAPNGYERMSERAHAWVQELGKLTPSMAGNQRADAAGSASRAALARAPINLSVPLTAFHFTKHLLAERKLDLFQTYYTETRILKMAPSLFGQSEDIEINKPDAAGRILHDLTIGQYTVRLMPTGSRLMSDEFAFDELMALKESGVTVPNNVLLAVSSINAKAEVIEQLRAANSGDVSPEQQRAQEIEMQRMEAELSDALEGVEAKRAQKILSLARARRAIADAEYNPRQEGNQIQRQRLLLEHQRNMRQFEESRADKETDVALDLVKIGSDEKKADQQAVLKQQAPQVTPPKKQPRSKKEPAK